MAINKTQQGIIDMQALVLPQDEMADAIESFLSALEDELKVELSREENSNIYIIVQNFITKIMAERYRFKGFVDGLNKFFDESKFDGYIAGSYSGVRQGLLALGIFTDVKLINKTNSQVQVILLGNDSVNLSSLVNKMLIAENLHKLLPLTVTYSSDSSGLVSQSYNASTGQAITYNWYIATKLVWKIKVTYTLDYEEAVEDYNFEEQIIGAVNNVYSKLYGKLGKDFKVKDFYSITRDVLGVSEVSISVDKGLDEEEATKDADITVEDINMFVFETITVVGG